MAHHELLGKVFAAFECRAGLGGTYDEGRAFASGKVVIYAGYERVFVSDHNHVDTVLLDKGVDGLEVERREADIFAIRTCAAVAGGYEESTQHGALGYLPGQGAFAAA